MVSRVLGIHQGSRLVQVLENRDDEELQPERELWKLLDQLLDDAEI